MAWVSPPTKIVEARDLLASLPSMAAAGFVTGSFHYPRLETSDTMPACLLERTSSTARRVTSGVTSGGTMGGGAITAVLYFDSATDDGVLEQLVADLADEACSANGDNLWVVECSADRCGAASPGMTAAGSSGQADQGKAFAGIVVVLTWEG